MCDAMDRDVWDCLVPAAIRDDLYPPQSKNADDVKAKSGDSFMSSDGAYHVAYRRRAAARKSKKMNDEENLWDVVISFFDGVKSPDAIIPPPVFFELHDLPQAPTWSEMEVDDDWLPEAPSLAFDEYSISDES
eukprot:scaffold1638_cov120-Cylindrotheca_fusiformis.AAC.9